MTQEDKTGIFFSPVGIAMMTLATICDVSELIVELIPVIGQALSIAIDFIALILIGGWMYFKSGEVSVPKKTAGKIGKMTKWTKRLKWLRPLCIVAEMIPIVSSIFPLWIVAVYFELKHG